MEWGWLPQLVVSITTGGLGWLIGWKLKERSEALKIAKQGIQRERMEAYADVMKPIIDRITSIGLSTSRSPTSTLNIQEWRQKHFQLMLFGDDEVIRLWNDLWQSLYKNPDSAIDGINQHVLHIGKIVLAIRKSLGHPATTLSETDMFAWLIRDLDKLELLKQQLAKGVNMTKGKK